MQSSATALHVARATLALAVVLGMGWVWGTESGPFAWTFDDSFYYLELGRNLAEGRGPTFDGINRTNGAHPLWWWTCSLLFALGLDGLAAMRGALSLQLVLYALVVLGGQQTLWRATASDPPPVRSLVLLVATALAINPSLFKTFVNGMEAGVSLPIQAALLALLASRDTALRERPWAVATLLVGAFLARTDGGLLTLTVLVWGFVRRVPPAILIRIAAPPAVALVLFLAINFALFETPMQVSGDLKRITPGPLRSFGLIVLVLCAAALLRVRPSEDGPFPTLRLFVQRTWPFAAFCLAVIGYYTCLQEFARLWYFVPVVLYGLAGASAGCIDISRQALSEALDKAPDVSPARALAPMAALLGLLVVLGAVWGALETSNSQVHQSRLANAEAGRWISANLPADTVLGSWDAGVVGYFTDQTVINLDGVVNSVQYKRALRAGTAGDLVEAWGVQYLVNHTEDPQDLRQVVDRVIGETETYETEREWPFVVLGAINSTDVKEHEMAVVLVRIRR